MNYFTENKGISLTKSVVKRAIQDHKEDLKLNLTGDAKKYKLDPNNYTKTSIRDLKS
jgi:hypothetical protein